MRLGLPLLFALAACSGSPTPPAPMRPAPVPVTATPQTAPPAKPAPGPTQSGCDGISDKGSCVLVNEHQVVRACDAKSNTLKADVDCTAASKVCVYDTAHVVSCGAPGSVKGSSSPPAGTMAGSGCNGLTYDGYCQKNNTVAHYCYQDTIVDWMCDAGETCVTDGRCGGAGAMCCPIAPPPTTPSPPPSPTSGCGGLTFDGVCENGRVKYCAQGTTIMYVDCGVDYPCQMNACATGAACCPVTAL
jgi:hypothetical protein